MTQENTDHSELPASQLGSLDQGIAGQPATITPTGVSWSMDVSPAVGVEHPAVAPVASPAADKPVPKPRRGLSRVAPKTGSSATKRREKLRKIREELSASKSGANSTLEATPVSKPAVEAGFQKATKPESKLKAPKAVRAKSKKPRQKKRSSKPAVSEGVVRAQVVAEIATLVSENLKAKPASSKPVAEKQVDEALAVPEEEFKSEPAVEADPVSDEPLFSPSVPVFAVTDPPPPEEEPYGVWLRRVVLKNKWMSVFTTFYVHWLILLALAAILVHGPENAASLLINATFASDDVMDEASFEVQMPEPQPMQEPQESAPETAAELPATLTESSLTLDESVLDKIAADAAQSGAESSEPMEATGQPQPNAGPNPAPTRAISKGSFSVWTEPTSPQAGEPYRIVIQVCLPNGLERYNVADLQGVVVGSDGYRKPIPGFLRGFLPVEDGYARLIIPIVSADEKVKDTVFIRSRVLKETQKLLIEFEPEQ